MKAAILLLASLVLAGCGGGPCRARSGTYRSKYAASSGNCKAYMENVTSMSDTGGCTVNDVPAEDNCSIAVDTTCPNGPGATQRAVGKEEWNQDGSAGTAVLTIVVSSTNGSQLCSSTYDVTHERL